MDTAALQVAIILLPGVIWALLDANYGAQVKRDQIVVITRAVLFGLASYAVTYVVYSVAGLAFTLPSVEGRSTLGVEGRFADELLTSIVVSIVLAVAWLYAQTYRVASRLLRWIGATNRYGDEDVWDHTLNSRTPETEYVNVRYFERKLVYAGFVESFSSSERARELLLRDVKMYDLDGEFLYDMPRIYLAFEPEAAHIEFPYFPGQESEHVERADQAGATA